MNGLGLVMQERTAAAEAFLPSRNVGLVLSGNSEEAVGPAGQLAPLTIGSTLVNPSMKAPGNWLMRGTWAPWRSSDESNLVHLGAGLRYSDTKQGVRFRTDPEVNDGPVFLDTGLLDADSSLTLNLEAAYWRKGPFWLTSEYFRADLNADNLNDPAFSGWNVTASWAVTGEMRSYNWRNGTFGPIRAARPVTVGAPGHRGELALLLPRLE